MKERNGHKLHADIFPMIRYASLMVRLFGCHVSAAGGLHNALEAAVTLGVNTIQVHASPPQRWNTARFKDGVEDQFLKRRATSQVERVFFHGIYLINLATPDPSKFELSKNSLVHALDLISRIAGDGVIFHVGSLKDQTDENAAYQQIISGIDWILDKTPDDAKLILEVAAGSGKVVGDRFEELARIYEGVSKKERVGFGLDSQHMWASGYDLQNDLEKILHQVEKLFGLEKVWCIHLNDSKTELGSKKDRHENIGEGLIGLETIKNLFCHKKLTGIPFVLETPAMKQLDTAALEVKKLQNFLV
ncbi:MAG: deoxyribonuclease IV [Bdellovibrionales bacterium]|nr:deoxyribonuclease IV [Bdellovibrionales bacterium]